MGKITRGAGATVDGAPADVDGRPVLTRGRYILVRDGAIDFLDGESLTAVATLEVDADGNLVLPSGLSLSGDTTVDNLTATGDVSLGGASTSIGFYGTIPGTKPTVTGVQTDGTALASLLTALDTLGLITDSSTES